MTAVRVLGAYVDFVNAFLVTRTRTNKVET